MTGGKWVKFVFLVCPVNPRKGITLGTKYCGYSARTFVFGVSRSAMTQSKTTCTGPEACKTAQIHRVNIVHLRYMYKHNSKKLFLMRMLLILKFIVKFERRNKPF